MRRFQIAPGVHLSYDAAQKFNRCRISIHFAFPARRETATAHALLPLVLERGQEVDARTASVERFWREGTLNEQSNVQFGEGGAGTFSDGKLTTGIKDVRIRKVLEEFVAASNA